MAPIDLVGSQLPDPWSESADCKSLEVLSLQPRGEVVLQAHDHPTFGSLFIISQLGTLRDTEMSLPDGSTRRDATLHSDAPHWNCLGLGDKQISPFDLISTEQAVTPSGRTVRSFPASCMKEALVKDNETLLFYLGDTAEPVLIDEKSFACARVKELDDDSHPATVLANGVTRVGIDWIFQPASTGVSLSNLVG